MASGFDRRRSSARLSWRLSDAAAASDDDYDLSAHAIADGFRPRDASPAPAPAPSQWPLRTPSLTAPSARTPPPASLPLSKGASAADRPTGDSKPPRSHDSLTLGHDGSASAHNRLGGAAVSSGLSNGDVLVQPESPYRGPVGPSHPYSLYPQRTYSNATSSTGPNTSRQSYAGPRGPTHPYALYPQTTTAAEETAQEQIPVGFSGMGNTYQRQLGPDGEEAGDLIGPLGHLEELPPYTRYPDDSSARRKSPEPANTAAVPSIPGAGGIGIATRNPEFSSTEDDLPALSRSRPTSRSETSQHEINTAARDVSEKPTMAKWQRRARKKLCGIVPYWAICLLVAGIVIIGIVLGTVIGTILAKNNNHPTDKNPSSDIEPLESLPSGLPPLATGSFSLPPLDVSQAPKSCFTDTTQAQAWSCEIFFRFYAMDVQRVDKRAETKAYDLSLTAINATDSQFLWGTQPPDVKSVSLAAVKDTFEPGRGPAWWGNMTYTKTVIVPEDKFQARNSKRYLDRPPKSPGGASRLQNKRFGAQAGERPWICTWPDTSLEVFIYANQPASFSPEPDPEGQRKPAYPQVVKLLERRFCDDPSAAAQCRQVEISDDGCDKKELKDDDGNPIVVKISENWRSTREQVAQRQRERHPSEKRWVANQIFPRETVELTDCGCLWWST
ncbi:hypothetical protein CDD83_8465 [Cordyceps sp. RAO-2017]|nr:hypothetical protein CDD83_8465 [Cordyceps sp. RAO-2017]